MKLFRRKPKPARKILFLRKRYLAIPGALLAKIRLICRSKCRKAKRLSFWWAGYTSAPVKIPCLQSTAASIR